MEGDPHLDRAWQIPGFGLETALQVDRRGDGVGGIGKDDEAGVALAAGADIDAVTLLNDSIDDLIVTNHSRAHRLFGVFPESG